MTACTPLLSICANHYPKIISCTRLYVNAGQTPTTAIPVGAGAWAGDEAADEVTATGAQTADPGKTLCSPDRHQHGGRSHFNLLTFFLFSFPRLNVRLWFNTETYYNRSCLEKSLEYFIAISVSGRSYHSSSRSSSRRRSHSRSSRYSWNGGKKTKSGHCVQLTIATISDQKVKLKEGNFNLVTSSVMCRMSLLL